MSAHIPADCIQALAHSSENIGCMYSALHSLGVGRCLFNPSTSPEVLLYSYLSEVAALFPQFREFRESFIAAVHAN